MVMGPQNIEQAYFALGLSVYASIGEVEQQYERIIRKLRSKQIRGALTAADEAEMRAASQAYRYILHEQNRQLAERFRARRYGRFGRFAGMAEKIDHFWNCHGFSLGAGAALAFVLILIASGVLSLVRPEQTAVAEPLDAELSILIAGAELPRPSAQSKAKMEQEWLRMAPEWKAIHTRFLPFPLAADDQYTRQIAKNSELALLAANPDVYILDRDNFIRLVRLGYLARLEQWDTYGLDLSGGPMTGLGEIPFRPVIAAIRADSRHHDHALQFIRTLLGGSGEPRFPAARPRNVTIRPASGPA